MNFLNQLTKSISSTNIFALDPSINNTGYCLLECFEDEIMPKYIGLVCPEEESDEERMLQIIEGVKDALQFRFRDKDKLIIVIEKPPYTIYNKQFDKNAIIARATKLFRLFLIYGALYHYFVSCGFKTISILPIEWQRKIKRKGFDIKKLSLGLANSRIVKVNGVNHRILNTVADENIADAVNIAFHTWLHRKKLLRNIFPELVKQS